MYYQVIASGDAALTYKSFTSETLTVADRKFKIEPIGSKFSIRVMNRDGLWVFAVGEIFESREAALPTAHDLVARWCQLVGNTASIV